MYGSMKTDWPFDRNLFFEKFLLKCQHLLYSRQKLWPGFFEYAEKNMCFGSKFFLMQLKFYIIDLYRSYAKALSLNKHKSIFFVIGIKFSKTTINFEILSVLYPD